MKQRTIMRFRCPRFTVLEKLRQRDHKKFERVMKIWELNHEYWNAQLRLQQLKDPHREIPHFGLYEKFPDKRISRSKINQAVSLGQLERPRTGWTHTIQRFWKPWEQIQWQQTPVSRPSVHSEKIRLNRHNRRRAKQLLEIQLEAYCDPPVERVGEWLRREKSAVRKWKLERKPFLNK